jgi:hypothetical protein
MHWKYKCGEREREGERENEFEWEYKDWTLKHKQMQSILCSGTVHRVEEEQPMCDSLSSRPEFLEQSPMGTPGQQPCLGKTRGIQRS